MALSLTGAFFTNARVSAAPVKLQDAPQQITDVVDPAELILEPGAFAVEAGVGPGGARHAPAATPGDLARANQARSPSLETTRFQAVAPSSTTAASGSSLSRGSDLAAEIRNTVKENVRPLHDQLLESGAMDVWKDLKLGLGLDKSKWDTDGTTGANMMTPDRPNAADSSRWQDAAQPPKTAAQAQVDRELASNMMEKLIDEVKPWGISLLALYLLGYLVKAGIGHSQRKSIRRRERETRRILRRASSKAASTKPEP